MKLSVFVFPALAFGATHGRHSNQRLVDTDGFFDAKFQERFNKIDLRDNDAAFPALTEQEELARSSRDLIGWNRYVNHGNQITRRMSSKQAASSQLEFILRTGNYPVNIMKALAKIKAQQTRLRRMKMIQILGY